MSAGWITALTFSVYQTVRNHLHGHVWPHADAFLAGVVGGSMPPFLTAGGLLLKVQLQNEHGLHGSGTLGLLRKLFREHGVSRVVGRMYAASLPINLMADSMGRGTYFACYDICKTYLVDSDGKLSLPRRILAAGFSGAAGWTSIYPLDTLRSRKLALPLFPPATA
eukprot:RCo005355